jgi:hypothetical protein
MAGIVMPKPRIKIDSEPEHEPTPIKGPARFRRGVTSTP